MPESTKSVQSLEELRRYIADTLTCGRKSHPSLSSLLQIRTVPSISKT